MHVVINTAPTKYLVCIMLLICFTGSSAAGQSETQAGAIEQRIETLEKAGAKQIGSYKLASIKFLANFYRHRAYAPAWANPKDVGVLARAVANVETHGLRAGDFHPDVLGVSAGGAAASLSAADRDIVQSDALFRLLYQLHFGKVSPQRLDKNWNLKGPKRTGRGLEIVSAALKSGELQRLIEHVSPQSPNYERLQDALRKYRAFSNAGGWQKIPDGAMLKPGASDPRIPTIRTRLSITGEYAGAADPNNGIFDPPLEDAVKRFQAKHGLDADGVVGPATLEAMNVSAKARVDQIRVNLERARWIVGSLKDQLDLVAVNTAGFYLITRLDGEFVWWTDVITGTPYHKTPMFTDTMKYVEFNPTWTIPPGILRKEILPNLTADPTYLASKGYDLIGSDGRKVDATAIDWAAQKGRGFPYSVVQPPGPTNALGRVKFMFPNKHNVYLHDTPSRQLFSKTGRAFSHGCVRVNDPLKLAEVLLGNRNGMTRQQIDQIVASGKLTRVNLKKPIKIAILYWTVDPLWSGGTRFYRDVYKRDGKILSALDSAFSPPIN